MLSHRLPKVIRDAISQLPDHQWKLGTRHWKLYSGGRLIAIMPLGLTKSQDHGSWGTANIAAQIRRAARTRKAS
jgi:hypothetical protein